MRRFAFAVTILVGLVVPFASALRAQEPTGTATQRPGKSVPTHAPRPNLPPARVLHHLRAGNDAAVAARASKRPAPAPRPRPSGAGRYLCAVFVCADADLDVAEVFGLERQDVLVFRSPGPLVQGEDIGLLEHFASEERLALVIVLSHGDCATASLPAGTPRQTALAARLAEARRRARIASEPLPRALARMQRETLLLSSELLQHSVAADRLRILPAEVDTKTLKVTWHTSRADEMPMAPVR